MMSLVSFETEVFSDVVKTYDLSKLKTVEIPEPAGCKYVCQHPAELEAKTL